MAYISLDDMAYIFRSHVLGLTYDAHCVIIVLIK